MNTLQLKQMLVQKIELIQDDSYLLAINTLIDSSINANKVFILNEEQKITLLKSKKQLENNEVTELEDTFDEIDLWLEKK
jgi:hypothetical protein